MAYQNPVYYSGDRLLKQYRRAADGLTWQAGQFCRLTDSGVVKVKGNGTQVQGIFSKSQATATSSTDVYIERITSANTRFVMAVTSTSAGTTDCRAASSMIGQTKNIAVGSCVCTVALNSDTNGVLLVDDLMSNLQSNQYATTDCPGYVLVSLTAASLTAQGDGL